MDYKTVMVCLALDRANDACLAVAGDIAERFGARVVGIAASDLRPSLYFAEGQYAEKILGQEEQSIRKRLSQLESEFRGAIEPLAKLVAEHITRDLFGKCIGWREFEFVFNDLSARDEDTELAIQVQLLAAGVYTVNEVRAMRGLGPIGEQQVSVPSARGELAS